MSGPFNRRRERRKAQSKRVYLARNTERPFEDIERGFSAWMGSAHNSKADTIEWALFDQTSPYAEDYFDPDPIWQDWQKVSGVPEQERSEYELGDYNPPEFLEWANENHFHMDVRPFKDKYFLVDHEGLAGYRVDAPDKASAISIGNEEAHTGHAQEAEGDTTVGNVRYEAPLAEPDWHLFSADDVIPESVARNRHG